MANKTIKVNVPGRSAFDKSFKNILTTGVGTITPIVSRLVIPGSKGYLKVDISASLPPLASDTFMRADLKVEAFLVPLRLLYGGFESWLTGKQLHNYSGSGGEVVAALPRLIEPEGSSHPFFAPGSLMDYLGARVDATQTIVTGSTAKYNIFFPLAYHKVYDDYYRNARVQKPVFMSPVNLDAVQNSHRYYLSALPYLSFDSIKDFESGWTFVDGTALCGLRQRNYGDDYFTVAQPSAQMGTAQSVITSSGSFTIASLRASNSLQQYSERSGLGSPRLQDFVRTHYGADLSNGVAQRSILLGSASFPVYTKGVDAQATSTATNNPFSSVGARYGNAFAAGTDFVCNFECNEPSILLVNASLVPEACYSSGTKKDLLLFTTPGSQVDLPDPLLENVGNEPISHLELSKDFAINNTGLVFGYVPRYTAHKSSNNEVHGLLRAGQSLASFVAQRDFPLGYSYGISSNFLQISPSALDNITAVTSDISSYGCWIDSAITLKVSEPLQESALPSLQDPAYEHGHSINVPLNGGSI